MSGLPTSALLTAMRTCCARLQPAKGPLVLVGLWAFLFLAFGTQGWAKEPRAQIKKDIEQGLRERQGYQQDLRELTQKERSIHAELSRLKDKIARLEADCRAQRQSLQGIQDQVRLLGREQDRLKREQDRIQGELAGIIDHLWPLHLAHKYALNINSASWAKNDRHFSWLKACYDRASSHLAAIKKKEAQLAANKQEQRRLAHRQEQGLNALQQAKDELLDNRLAYLGRVRAIRSQRLAKEEQLASIRKTIKSLRYELRDFKAQPMAKQKGALPWPAQGEVIRDFAPEARNPHRGISLALDRDQVQAIAPGKVVHNDQLWGMGQVVIVLHPGGYYSLYALLAESLVQLGQEVEPGSLIGRAGYYPQAKGLGMYFELRSGQKAINPKSWLAKR